MVNWRKLKSHMHSIRQITQFLIHSHMHSKIHTKSSHHITQFMSSLPTCCCRRLVGWSGRCYLLEWACSDANLILHHDRSMEKLNDIKCIVNKKRLVYRRKEYENRHEIYTWAPGASRTEVVEGRGVNYDMSNLCCDTMCYTCCNANNWY
jgi:hypothetical protein